MNTGEMIRDLLKEKRKTQVELARFLTNATGKEVSTNTVNRWIPNDSNPDKKVYPPSAKYLPLIAKFLRVPVDILLGDAGVPDTLKRVVADGGLNGRMIKCCQNCHWFRKGADVCESGEILTNTDLWMAVQLLLENGEIAGLCEDLNLQDYGDEIAEFFQDRLQAATSYVNIKDSRNFCCNAWR